MENTAVDTPNIISLQVIEIWSDVLKAEVTSENNDFFDMGGNSIQAHMLLARLQEHFKISLEIDTLIDHPTIGALAGYLRNNIKAKNLTRHYQSNDKETAAGEHIIID